MRQRWEGAWECGELAPPVKWIPDEWSFPFIIFGTRTAFSCPGFRLSTCIMRVNCQGAYEVGEPMATSRAKNSFWSIFFCRWTIFFWTREDGKELGQGVSGLTTSWLFKLLRQRLWNLMMSICIYQKQAKREKERFIQHAGNPNLARIIWGKC